MLHVFAHPGTEEWAPDEAFVKMVSKALAEPYHVHLHPRSEVAKVWSKNHGGKPYDKGEYKFRAYQDGKSAWVFVDETETPESVKWLIIHELTHLVLRNKLPALWRIYQGLTPERYNESDEWHEKDPEEQLANQVAVDIVGANYPRLWWRKRVEEMGNVVQGQ